MIERMEIRALFVIMQPITLKYFSEFDAGLLIRAKREARDLIVFIPEKSKDRRPGGKFILDRRS